MTNRLTRATAPVVAILRLLTVALGLVILALTTVATSAQAGQMFILQEGSLPPGLVGGQQTLTPNPDARSTSDLVIRNSQWAVARVTFTWHYETGDTSPAYDMATYQVGGQSTVNLIQPRGPRTQDGTQTVEIPPYQYIKVTANSDGAGRTADLRLTVQSITFPPALETSYIDWTNLQSVSTRDTILDIGVAAEFLPVRRGLFDAIDVPATVFSIQPALPAGLSMNSDGLITGTPTAAQPVTTYTVTATRGGASSTKDITIEVVDKIFATVSVSDVTAQVGTAITPVTPVVGNNGKQALSYSVSPALPPGLSMNPASGSVSGTPTAYSASTTYTVTVTDGATSDSKRFNLAVKLANDTPIATPEVVTWQAGVASEVTFTVRPDIGYIEGPTEPYISLKKDGGPELKGTPGYPTLSNVDQPDALAMKFTWASPIAGTYSGKLYFYYYDTLSNAQSRVIPFTLIVTGDKTDQTISFSSTAPDAVAGVTEYMPTATATSGLTVDFSIDSVSADVCQITAGDVSFLDAGLCVINADQPGDSQTNPAPQVQQVVTVAAGPNGTTTQTVSFTSAAPSPTAGGFDYTPSLSATSGLPVTLYGDVDSRSVCWPIGDAVTFFAEGSCTVHAEQVGNITYAAAEASQTFTVAAAPVATQAIAATALSLNVAATGFTPVTVTGGVGPYGFDVQPALPAGLSMSTSTGEVTGTPTALSDAGSYTVTITDANGASASETFTLGVTDGPAASVTIASKGLTVNRATSGFTPVTAIGGTGDLTYGISPSLPSGLFFNPGTGQITGTPDTVSAATVYTVTVTDDASETDTKSFSLTVNPSVVAAQAVADAHATAGAAVTAITPVTASGGTAPLAFTVQPALPSGLAMASGTGAITGTASAAAVAATYTVTVTDAEGDSDSADFSLTVEAAVTATQAIASKTVTAGTQVTAFTPVTGGGGRAALAYSVAPALPVGLELDPVGGAITGTATAVSAAQSYTVTVTDANGASATASFSLAVNGGVVATQAVASNILSATVAATGFTPVAATGGTGNLIYSIAPDLPGGLTLSDSTGEITGTPTAASSLTTYTVTATDANGATGSATFTLSVNGPLEASVAVASTSLTIDAPVTPFTPVTSIGGTGTIDFAIQPALPTGLSLSPTTGEISGTPTVTSAETTYTVTLTDDNATTASGNFSLTVNTITTTTSLLANPTNPQPGDTVTFTANVLPATATGSVSFKEGDTTLATVPLSAGSASFQTSALGVGSHVITAVYSGSASHATSSSAPVTISLQTPATALAQRQDQIRDIIQRLATAELTFAGQGAQDAVGDATGRLIAANSGTVTTSAMNGPTGFDGVVDAKDGAVMANGQYFAFSTMGSAGATRFTNADVDVVRDASGGVTLTASGRVAWEWARDGGAFGTWLNGTLTRAEIAEAMSGQQEGFGGFGGVYAVQKLGPDVYANGFAMLGMGWRDLGLADDTLTISSRYMTHTALLGGALTATMTRGRMEFRPELAFTHGYADIGTIGLTGSAFGQVDDALNLDVGGVSLTTISVTPTLLVKSVDQLGQFDFSPSLKCQRVKGSALAEDCGYGLALSYQKPWTDGLGDFSAKVEFGRLGDQTMQSLALNVSRQF